MSSHIDGVAIVGAGPAGLMAAEVLARKGINVTIFDGKPSPARKFLMAGRGGLNLTHSEPLDVFETRFGSYRDHLAPIIAAFPPAALITWAENLGQKTFIGSSGRVFPVTLKASPLLRAWLRRLDKLGVKFKFRHDWTGWQPPGLATSSEPQHQTLVFNTPDGTSRTVRANAVILAMGGASWPRLGADGRWVEILKQRGVAITPLTPFNAGILIPWSQTIKDTAAGAPLKRISATIAGITSMGEAVITRTGLEGGTIYNLNRPLKYELANRASANLSLDLRPDLELDQLTTRLSAPRARQSTATFLRKAARLSKPAIAILREPSKGVLPTDPRALAQLIKAVPLSVTGLSKIDRAISTSGGVNESELDDTAMLMRLPGVFVAGEMRNWDAPTGGYLLQATFSTAVQAALGARAWLKRLDLRDKTK